MTSVKIEMKDSKQLLKARQLEGNGKAQRFVDSEVLRLCSPLLPHDSGALVRSGTGMTVLGSGEVQYATPYARRWYYTEAHFTGAPQRGTFWFERMKKNGGKDAILAGARKVTGAK